MAQGEKGKRIILSTLNILTSTFIPLINLYTMHEYAFFSYLFC